jgi:hypothetical protein
VRLVVPIPSHTVFSLTTFLTVIHDFVDSEESFWHLVTCTFSLFFYHLLLFSLLRYRHWILSLHCVVVATVQDLLLNLHDAGAISNCSSLHHVGCHLHYLFVVKSICLFLPGCLEVSCCLDVSVLLLLKIVLDHESLHTLSLLFTEQFPFRVRPFRDQFPGFFGNEEV